MMVAADATDLHSIGGEPQLPPRLGALLHLAGAQAAFIMAAADATDLYSIGGEPQLPPRPGALLHLAGAQAAFIMAAADATDLELYFISRARRPPS